MAWCKKKIMAGHLGNVRPDASSASATTTSWLVRSPHCFFVASLLFLEVAIPRTTSSRVYYDADNRRRGRKAQYSEVKQHRSSHLAHAASCSLDSISRRSQGLRRESFCLWIVSLLGRPLGASLRRWLCLSRFRVCLNLVSFLVK